MSVRVSAALASVEARRLLRSPALLVSLALSGALLAFGPGRDDSFVRYKLLAGAGCVILAAGAAIASGLAASRIRRSGTDELFGSLPAPAPARTAAHLLSVGAVVGVAIGVVLVLCLRQRAWAGVPVPLADGIGPDRLTPGAAALAQGPAIVALAGVVGVALGLWVRSVLVWSSLVMAGFYVLALPMLWWSWDWRRWLVPLTDGLDTGGFVDGGRAGSVLIVHGAHTAAMGWHVLYVIALAAVVSAVALARHRPAPGTLALAAGGVALGTFAGAAQVMSAR